MDILYKKMKKNIHVTQKGAAMERVKMINLFLDFAQIDLEKINIADKSQAVSMYYDLLGPWIVNGEAFIFPASSFFGMPAMSGQLDGLLRDLVPRWFEAIKWIVDHSTERWELFYKIFHVTEWRPAELGGRFITHYQGDPKVTEDPVLKVQLSEKPVLKVYALKDDKREAPAEISFPYGFQFFIELLDGYSTSSLKRCLHCNRFFFIATRKLRNYCTPFCQKAAGMKRLRNRKKIEAEEVDKYNIS